MFRPVLPLFFHIREFGWGVQAVTRAAQGADFRGSCVAGCHIHGADHSTNGAVERRF